MLSEVQLLRTVRPELVVQIILMAGLQGVGKTTACGKLATLLKKQNRKVLLVATDVYRPAAIEQLKLLGRKAAVSVFEMGTEAKPVDIATTALEKARAEDYDTIIVDTAGRLQAGPHRSCLHRQPPAECLTDVARRLTTA